MLQQGERGRRSGGGLPGEEGTGARRAAGGRHGAPPLRIAAVVVLLLLPPTLRGRGNLAAQHVHAGRSGSRAEQQCRVSNASPPEVPLTCAAGGLRSISGPFSASLGGLFRRGAWRRRRSGSGSGSVGFAPKDFARCLVRRTPLGSLGFSDPGCSSTVLLGSGALFCFLLAGDESLRGFLSPAATSCCFLLAPRVCLMLQPMPFVLPAKPCKALQNRQNAARASERGGLCYCSAQLVLRQYSRRGCPPKGPQSAPEQHNALRLPRLKLFAPHSGLCLVSLAGWSAQRPAFSCPAIPSLSPGRRGCSSRGPPAHANAASNRLPQAFAAERQCSELASCPAAGHLAPHLLQESATRAALGGVETARVPATLDSRRIR